MVRDSCVPSGESQQERGQLLKIFIFHAIDVYLQCVFQVTVKTTDKQL